MAKFGTYGYNPLLRLSLVLLLLASNSISDSTAQLPNAGDLAKLRTIAKDWGSPAALSPWAAGNWTGVTCNSNGQVTALSLTKLHVGNPIPAASICSLEQLSSLDASYNNLTGEFPTALYGCSALQFLDLSNNQLAGSLPRDINKLSSEMLHLNLSANGFVGQVPSAIAGFPKLKSLLLDTNGFNGSYPAEAIGQLPELETLTLANNPFAPGPIPDAFGKLTKLTLLWLSGMNLTGRIPSSLSALTELSILDMSVNKLQGEIPEWIWKLQKLQYLYLFANKFTGRIGPFDAAASMLQLDLSSNRLTGPIHETIGSMKNLSLLFLYYNYIAGPIPASLGLLPNLADIRLFDNKLSGPLPPELGKHSPLGNFEVSNNLLSGELPETLCANKHLFDLVVFGNGFSGAFPASLGDCDTLDNIMAHYNRFVGDFPEKIWSFPKLTTVQIHDNSFTGTLPANISPLISRIEMENNKFSGAVPTSAPGLKVFWAQNNLFSGELPRNMSGLSNLTDLNLSGNRISGSIPASIQLLGRLNYLVLSNNEISGPIPAEIGSLPALNSLELSNNELTGTIPPEFGNLHLNLLNLSDNALTGEVPPLLQNPAYEQSFLGNPLLCARANVNKKMNLRACEDGSSRNGKLSMELTIVFSLLALLALVGAVATGCLIIRRQKQRKEDDLIVWKMTPFRAVEFSERDVVTGLREENVIGSGGFGKVYRVLLPGGAKDAGAGAVVAVKKLWNAAGKKSDAKLDKEFESEVRILGDIRHNNIVSLLCCISGGATKLLVYEYMENGSLDRWLHRRERGGAPLAPLDWPTRLAVAIDAARGLSYMHHESAQPIMHRDVKSSNILLDPGFRAKIADFGLARMLVKSGEPEALSAIGGTFGYMAPEYGYRAKVNEKVDVYSFGVVLLELTTGRVANDGGADCCLAEWAWRRYKAGGQMRDAIDADIVRGGAFFLDDVVSVFMLGVICTGDDPASRPSMKEVLDQLLRYDRTSSVASACRDEYGKEDGVVQKGRYEANKKGDMQGKDVMEARAAWSGGEEDSGNFVAHPV